VTRIERHQPIRYEVTAYNWDRDQSFMPSMPAQDLQQLQTAITDTHRDRRHRPRLRLSYSVRLSRPGGDFGIEARTENISCEGFFFISERPFLPHERLDCQLMIPDQQPGQASPGALVLHCRAEVVRIVPGGSRTQFGVACKLEDYSIDRAVFTS